MTNGGSPHGHEQKKGAPRKRGKPRTAAAEAKKKIVPPELAKKKRA